MPIDKSKTPVAGSGSTPPKSPDGRVKRLKEVTLRGLTQIPPHGIANRILVGQRDNALHGQNVCFAKELLLVNDPVEGRIIVIDGVFRLPLSGGAVVGYTLE
jgi:hypothetical protein